MIVRRAQIQDVPSITDLWKEFMDFHRHIEPFFTRSRRGHRKFADLIRENMHSTSWLTLVAEDDGALAGYLIAALMQYPPVFDETRFGFIQDIAVTESRRRRGIGEALYREAEAWMVDRGCTRIELQAAARNPISIAFWKKMGFDDFVVKLAKRPTDR